MKAMRNAATALFALFVFGCATVHPAWCCTREGLARHEAKHLDGYEHAVPANPMLLSLRKR